MKREYTGYTATLIIEATDYFSHNAHMGIEVWRENDEIICFVGARIKEFGRNGPVKVYPMMQSIGGKYRDASISVFSLSTNDVQEAIALCNAISDATIYISNLREVADQLHLNYKG